MIEEESAHETKNENRIRLIFFAAAKDIMIRSTTFQHKTIHKATWKLTDEITCN